MKMQDIDLFIKDGKIVVGRTNKRNQIKNDYKDVTKKVVDFFVKIMESEKGKFIHYIINEKHYSIVCRELSIEELEELEIQKKKKSKGTYKTLQKFLMLSQCFNVCPGNTGDFTKNITKDNHIKNKYKV